MKKILTIVAVLIAVIGVLLAVSLIRKRSKSIEAEDQQD